MDTNENKEKREKKVNTTFFGRARRYELLEKAAYVLVGFLALFLIYKLVTTKEVFVEKNVDFEYLRNYMESKGYRCELIHTSGGSCYFKNDYIRNSFDRYDNGFVYTAQTDTYYLVISHLSNSDDYITFQTFSDAYAGYKNRDYKCSFKNDEDILEGIKVCETKTGEELDAQVYLGIINRAINDLNEVVDSSGYNRDILMKDYLWEKNK